MYQVTTREELHQLIDELPEQDAQRLLSDLRRRSGGELPRSLREAPFDDEPVTDEDRAALAEAEEDFAAGRVVSHDEIRREFAA